MVCMLAIGHKVSGFRPGQGRWILTALKIRSTTPFGREVKPSVSCFNTLQYAEDL
jgi:hypothetical protein